MDRIELIGKIRAARDEIKTAGCVHRRDLHKHIKRMERELHDYDRFQAEAAKG